MNSEEALNAARRHVDDAIDSIDEVESQSTATIISVALLAGARLSIDARLAKEEEKA